MNYKKILQEYGKAVADQGIRLLRKEDEGDVCLALFKNNRVIHQFTASVDRPPDKIYQDMFFKIMSDGIDYAVALAENLQPESN